MKGDSIITALNELIEASKDGEQGLALAAKDAREPEHIREHIRVFSEGETANRAAAAELQDQVRQLGGVASEAGSVKAAARRSWRSIRAMVSPRDDETILEECERSARANPISRRAAPPGDRRGPLSRARPA